MTTTVIVKPFGHNAKVTITGDGPDRIETPDPHGETSYAVFDARAVKVEEAEGWAEKPTSYAEPKAGDLTFGGKAVGLAFNPSGDSAVNRCKVGFANLIDQMHDLRSHSADSEQKRLASVAITEAQTAQMWAVKALTWK